MKTSAAGIAAIRQREGCRLTAYRDSVGVLTIGVGHTGRASRPLVYSDMKITQEHADAILVDDLAPFEAAVNTAGPMTQNQFDALVSLAFNIGAPAFMGSTVRRLMAAGDTAGAADAILKWDKPAVLKGRREAERAQFLGTNETAPARPAARSKAAAGAVVVAAGAGAALVPHGSYWMAGLVVVAMIAAAVAICIHFKK